MKREKVVDFFFSSRRRHTRWNCDWSSDVLLFRSVWALAWSPDGKHIASGSEDRTVQVWKVTTGHRILTYRGHADIVGAVAWSPDGKRIASVGDDVRIWQA